MSILRQRRLGVRVELGDAVVLPLRTERFSVVALRREQSRECPCGWRNGALADRRVLQLPWAVSCALIDSTDRFRETT